jgi:tRNA(Ile)-lysidine synthase
VGAEELLARCSFPAAGQRVDLAVSGGADSTALALLARAARLEATLHHVDHRIRPDSSDDADLAKALANDLEMAFVLHVVEVGPGANLEARARAARRAALPRGALTGHSMDDLAETILINMLRGAGVDGLSPMVGDPTKPLLDLRRSELRGLVEQSGRAFANDASNLELTILRNKIRLEVLPGLDAAAGRDVVPVLARQARLVAEERRWLDVIAAEEMRSLSEIDCRELVEWPIARTRRWLRRELARDDDDGRHPPSADEVERAMAVIGGDAVATELSGGRRLSRSGRHLKLAQ